MFGLLIRGCDIAYRWLHGLTDPAAAVGPALRVGVARHRGRAIVLADGTQVPRGHRVGIIHLNNEHVAGLHGDGSHTPLAGLKFRRRFVASLQELARQVSQSERYAGVEAFVAETILHSGTQRAGFEILPLGSSLRSRVVAFYERKLLAYYHPLGDPRTTRPRFSEARAIWISRKELLRRYGPAKSALSDTSS